MLFFLLYSWIVNSGRNWTRNFCYKITYTNTIWNQPLILFVLECFGFIANCCSFVFASSTLYRIIKLRMVLWFVLKITAGGSFFQVFFSVLEMGVCVCVLYPHTCFFFSLAGLDKSVRLQFNPNGKHFFDAINTCIWIQNSISVYIHKRTSSPGEYTLISFWLGKGACEMTM